MDELEPNVTTNNAALKVALMVIVGIAVLALGGYLAYRKKHGGGETAAAPPEGFSRWCELRREWAKKVVPLAGDIVLKSIKESDKEAREALVLERNQAAQDYAAKMQALLKGDPTLWTTVQKVEEELVVEGKKRANLAVKIANILAQPGEHIAALEEQQEQLEGAIRKEIKDGKANAAKALEAEMAKLKGVTCPGIYIGPMTDKGTSGNPYTSWEELEMDRTLVIKALAKRIEDLRPAEEFANRIRHDLFAQYRKVIKACYDKAKAKNPEMSDKMGLRVRQDRRGKVKSLAIEWMATREESVLDCLLEDAGRWRLPAPPEDMEYSVVTLDFSEF